MHIFQFILRITLGRWAHVFLFSCFSEETEAQKKVYPFCPRPRVQYVAGLGAEMPVLPLGQMAFLPSGTSSREAGEQEKAEVPPLQRTAVTLSIKNTTLESLLKGEKCLFSPSDTWEPGILPLEFGMKSSSCPQHFVWRGVQEMPFAWLFNPVT